MELRRLAVLATLEVDQRVAAVVALAPAGNSTPLPGIIPATLTFAWKREVPTLYLVADATGSHHCPVSTSFSSGLRLAGGRSSFRALTIGTSTHQIVEPGPCSSAHAHTFTRGLSLAHLDAVLRRDKAAQRFLEGDPVAALRERGVNALDYPRRSSA